MPEVLRQLQARYRLEAASDDPVVRRVAQLQLERLLVGRRRARQHTRRTDGNTGEVQPTRWAFALEQLLTEAGNPPLRWRDDDSYDCGHEPRHRSSSGTCLWVHPTEGRYWCRSCDEWGDALEWVMRERGCALPAAYAALLERFGPPFKAPTP